jgi:uncharacterized protein
MPLSSRQASLEICPEPFDSLEIALMKLHSTNTQQYQTVTAYDEHGVELNAVRFEHSLIVLPETAPAPWPVDRFEQLTAGHFEQIAATKPDVVILGTGNKQHFVHPRLITALTSDQKGVECMDNQAACRTYNILMSEGRKVVLALIMEAK